MAQEDQALPTLGQIPGALTGKQLANATGLITGTRGEAGESC